MHIRPGDRFRILSTFEHGRVYVEGVARVVREIPSLFDRSEDSAVAFVEFEDGTRAGDGPVERVVYAANRVGTTGDLFAESSAAPAGGGT